MAVVDGKVGKHYFHMRAKCGSAQLQHLANLKQSVVYKAVDQ